MSHPTEQACAESSRQPNTKAELSWSRRRLPVRLMVGELTMAKVNVEVMRLESHFGNLGNEPDSLAGLLDSMPRDIEALYMRSHPIRQDLPPITRLPGLIKYVPVTYNHFVTDTTGSFDCYLKHFKKSSLQELQRKIRRLKDACGGRLDLRQYRSPGSMAEFYKHARAVSSTTYQERLLKCGFPEGPKVVPALEELAEQGQVRGYVLFIQGKPASYSYAKLHDDMLLGQFIGFDEEFRKWGPGSILQYCIIEMMFQEGGYRMFDHGMGEGFHKEFFSNRSIRCADIFYFRPSIKAHLLVRTHLCLSRLSSAAGRSLDKLGLKALIKRTLRKSG